MRCEEGYARVGMIQADDDDFDHRWHVGLKPDLR
jgi:hypothetical protein